MAESVQTIFHRYQPGSAEAAEALPGINFTHVTEIVVTHEPVSGSPVPLLRDTHYTITLPVGGSDGTITAIGSWPEGDVFHAERQTPIAQMSVYEPHKVPPGKVVESDLDRLTRIAQEQQARISRAVQVPLGEQPLVLDPGATREGGVARFVGQRLTGVSLAELAVLLDPQKKAGTTLAYTEAVAPRSEIDVFNPDGIGEGGYWCEFAVGEVIPFVRAYAKVYAGTGTCDVQMIAGGQVLWSKNGVGSTPTDETIAAELQIGDDLVLIVENITGTVTGLVVKLEGEPA